MCYDSYYEYEPLKAKLSKNSYFIGGITNMLQCRTKIRRHSRKMMFLAITFKQKGFKKLFIAQIVAFLNDILLSRNRIHCWLAIQQSMRVAKNSKYITLVFGCSAVRSNDCFTTSRHRIHQKGQQAFIKRIPSLFEYSEELLFILRATVLDFLVQNTPQVLNGV